MRVFPHLCLLLLFPLALNAFSPQPGFDLIRSVGSSELIVIGHLGKNGDFTVSEVLAGKMPEKGLVKLDNTQWVPEHLAKPLNLKGDPELMLFLSDPKPQQHFWLYSTRLVAVDDAGALWAFLDSAISMAGHSLQPMQGVTKPQMLGFVRQKLILAQALNAIIEQPSSTARTEKLVRFLQENFKDIAKQDRPEQSRWLDGMLGYQSFYLEQAAKALNQMSQDEAGSLLTAVEQSKDDAERAMFLYLLGASCPAALFERVRPWADPGRGVLTRQMAFAAVMRCDYEKGIDCLMPLLRPEEPQLSDVLGALPGGWPRRTRWPKAVVVPIRELGDVLLKIRLESDSDENTNRGYAVLGKLSYFSHPSFIPVVLAWASSGKSNSAQAASDLANMLGFQNGTCNLEQMSDWIAKNQKALTWQYDLEKKPEEWMRAFKVADTHLKPLLLRLWQFEDRVDESYLMRESSGGDFIDEAKSVLAHLWQQKLLSRATQREIAQRFVSFSLEERQPAHSKKPILCLIETRAFTFPDSAWVYSSSDIAVNCHAVELSDERSYSSHGLKGSEVMRAWLCRIDKQNTPKVHVVVVGREGGIAIEPEKRWQARWEANWPSAK